MPDDRNAFPPYPAASGLYGALFASAVLPLPSPRSPILSSRRPAASSNFTLSRIRTVAPHTVFGRRHLSALGMIIVSGDAGIESYELGGAKLRGPETQA
jgi:hypothetical protein